MTGGGTPALSRRDYLLMAGLFCLALGIKVYFLPFFRVISSDGVSYAQIARDFATGHGLGRAIHYPPFFPILMGLVFRFLPDIELAGRVTAMVMGSLLVVPVYLLALEFFDRRAGIVAAVISLTWPSLFHWSMEVMTQSTYITLSLLGVWCVWRSWDRDSWRAAVAGGACMGMAHLTRSEGGVLYAAISVVLVAATFVFRQPRGRLRHLLAGWLVFWAICFPYVLFLHDVTGKWELTGKGKISIADALGAYLGKHDLGRDPHFQEIGLVDLVMKYPGYLQATSLKNLKKFLNEFLPVYLWLLVGIGFLAGGWKRARVLERAYLVATFAPLAVIIMVFLMGPEYDQPYLPVMFLWAGQGMASLESVLTRSAGVGSGLMSRVGRGLPLALGAAVAISAWNLYGQLPADRDLPYHFSQDGGRYDQKRIGLLLAKELPPGTRIMTRWGRIAFYANHESVDIPQAELDEILATARKSGVRYLVVDGMLAGLRPQLGVLLAPVMVLGDRILEKETDYSPLPGVRLYLLYREPSSLGVAVYELPG